MDNNNDIYQTDGNTSWAPDPNGRGTIQLLFSCALALVLSLYTSLHLDVAVAGIPAQRRYFEKIKWTFLGLFFAEVPVFVAYLQFTEAWKLYRRLRAERQESDSGEKGDHGRSDTDARPWSMMACFFVVMGGFAIEEVSLRHGESAEGDATQLQRRTLTPAGFLTLHRTQSLVNKFEGQIRDKSKQDSLGKVFVCLQAAWMIVQVITRLILHQPVTLLEISTVTHIYHAMAIYLFWWCKPRDIYEPIVIDGDRETLEDMVKASGLKMAHSQTEKWCNHLTP